jgi:catalase (peroxidase I)
MCLCLFQPGTLPQLDPQLLGPICVNAEGTNGTNNPANSTEEIRIQFAVKGFNDTETVALVGGGHSFGKTHGACPLGFGSLPNEDPANAFEGELRRTPSECETVLYISNTEPC